MPLTVLSHSIWPFVAAVPLIYVFAVWLGRTLKRRQKVWLGFAYQLFCIVVAFWIPLHTYLHFVPEATEQLQKPLKHINALTAVFGMFFVVALMRRYVWQSWFEARYRMRAPKFLADLCALILFSVAVVYAISVERGQPITGLAVGSTLLAAIIGLALQDLLGNIIAGISLELGKPFRPGDWLMMDNRSMEVMEVNWRSTRLRTNDNTGVDVPNKTIAGSNIFNLNMLGRQHALRVQVSLDMSLPPNVVKDRLTKAARTANGVLEIPAPKVFLVKFGDFANTYEIKFWIDEEAMRTEILDHVHTNIWYEAQRTGMRMPYPTQTVQLERPGRRREARLEAARTTLRKQPFLQMLDAQQTDSLMRGAHPLRFGRGEHIIVQGAEGHSMFIVLGGEAEVFVRAGEQETKVGDLRPGDYCGEMSLLTGEPRSATVIARTDCELWEIDKAVLGELFEQNPELMEKLSAVLAERRLENEGILASAASETQVEIKTKEYTESFLARVSAFFNL